MTDYIHQLYSLNNTVGDM